MNPIAAASLALLIGCAAPAGPTRTTVLPSATDPAIRSFDSPHAVYVNRDIVVRKDRDLPADRHQLLLWLTGTGGRAENAATGFCTLAADLGYRVVSLMYPDDVPATACAGDPDPGAFEAFRTAVLLGGRAPYQSGRRELVVERADSIEGRLSSLLRHLQEARPEEGWAEFLGADGAPHWESIAVAGQSQGGGHAALMGIRHRMARVVCFGSPKDRRRMDGAPAAWYGNASATPKDRFFAFNHHQDPIGCTPEELLRNLEALGLDAFGAPADVDVEPFPFRHARILYTGTPRVAVSSVDGREARTAHGAAINTRSAARWKPVWTYLLTE